jgi:uncharacterized protein (DUF934 family)
MALWRDGGFVDDRWSSIGEGEPVPAAGPIIVSIDRWRAERDQLHGRSDPVGVAIGPGKDAPEELNDVVDRPLVVLDFPKFADGRAFSLAQLLRRRHQYKGEIRAGGEVLLDEIALMLRCGFDSFEITHEPTLQALRNGWKPPVSLYYQPSLGTHEAPAGTRPWLRRATG